MKNTILRLALSAMLASGLVGCVESSMIARIKALDNAHAQGTIGDKEYVATRKKWVAEQEAYSARITEELARAAEPTYGLDDFDGGNQ